MEAWWGTAEALQGAAEALWGVVETSQGAMEALWGAGGAWQLAGSTDALGVAWWATDWMDAALCGSVGRGWAATRGFDDALVSASDASLREGDFEIALGEHWGQDEWDMVDQ